MSNVNKPGCPEWEDVGPKQLIDISVEALKICPPAYVTSFLGNPLKWVFTRDYSEFTLANIYRPLQTLSYAIDLTVPAFPAKAPAPLPPLVKRLFWRPTRMLFNPDHNQNPSTYPEESWFFINGIGTNERLARLNASYLSKLFHRPMQLVQNSTDSLLVDLAECAVGKGLRLNVMTEPARVAYPAILAALKNPAKERVVVVCHSQGTIIMSNVLRALQCEQFRAGLFDESNRVANEPPKDDPLPLKQERLLKKLEIYAFANCATNMETTVGEPHPYIESFGNQFDVVARLGCLSPKKGELGIDIDGPVFEQRGKWGHLLNAHYLFDIESHLADNQANPYVDAKGNYPRLFQYYAGAKAPLLYEPDDEVCCVKPAVVA